MSDTLPKIRQFLKSTEEIIRETIHKVKSKNIVIITVN